MALGTRLQAIEERPDLELIGATSEPSPPSQPERALTGLLITSLRALSQRALVALSALGDMLLIASVFVLWLLIIQEPSTPQLVGVGGYAAFALMALVLRRRR